MRMNLGDNGKENTEKDEVISNSQSFIQISMEPTITSNTDNDQMYTGSFEDHLQALRESSLANDNEGVETFDDFYFEQIN